MANILIVYETEIPTVVGYINDTKNSSVDGIVCEARKVTEVRTSDIDWADTVTFLRPQSVVTDIIAKKAKETGAFVMTFCDDNLLNLPKGIPSIPWRTKGLIKTLKNSDLIQSSSKYIGEEYKKYTLQNRCQIADTTISKGSLEDVKYKDSEEYPIKIVYAAGRDHSSLFDELVLPVLPKLKEKYNDRITFTFVGVKPNVEECSKYFKTEQVSGMPLLEYRKFMKDSKFDIGIAPLHDTEFNKCKYFNKYIEYTLVGIPGIYSNNEPYTYVIENCKNGLLANNTTGDWFDALSKMIDDFGLRKAIFNNSKKHLLENFNPEYLAEKAKKEVPEYFKKKDVKGKCTSLKMVKYKYYFCRIFDVIYLFFYYLKYEGLKSTINKIKGRL